MAPRSTLSPLALAVLAILDEAPTHPYRIQALIRERGMAAIVNVRNRNSLYQTIGQLERRGLIKVRETARVESRPERTVYQITRGGRQSIHAWLKEVLSSPAPGFPPFPAALSFMHRLTPDVAEEQLTRRCDALAAEQRRLAAVLEEHAQTVPRLFLLEVEYLQASIAAELAWVRSVVDDLRAGRLARSLDGAAGHTPEPPEHQHP